MIDQAKLNQFVSQARAAKIPEEQINSYLKTKYGVGGGQQDNAVAAPQKSVGGFVSNVGRDVVENVKGIAAIPSLALRLASNPSQILETAGRVASGVIQDYGSMITNPGQYAYEKPVSALLNVVPALGTLKKLSAASKVGKVAEVAKAADTVGDVARTGKMAKVGEAVSEAGSRFSLRGIKPSPSQYRKFLENTGEKMENVVNKYKAYDFDGVQKAIQPLQDTFDDLALKSGKTVSAKQVGTYFDKKISELTTGANALDPVEVGKAQFLTAEKARVLALPEFQAGGEASKVGLDFITKARRAIDNNTKDFALDPNVASQQRLLGDVYRQIVSDTAGTKQIGLELQNLRALEDVFHQNIGKGKGTAPLGLSKLVAGGTGGAVAGIPGAAAGMALEAGLNNPKVIGKISSGLNKVGEKIAGINPTLPQVTTGKVATGAIVGRNVAPTPAEAMQQTTESEQPILSPGGQWRWDSASNDWVKNTDGGANQPDLFKQAIDADIAATGGKNITKLISLKTAGYFGTDGKGKKMTEKQAAYSAAAGSGEYALNLLESGNVKTGLGQSIIGSVGEKLGTNTPTQQDYRSTLAAARTSIRNALLGANMSKQEMESLMAFIPDYNDAPEIAKQKLKTFIREANRFSGQNVADTVPATPDMLGGYE